jgi:hypothetical protein
MMKEPKSSGHLFLGEGKIASFIGAKDWSKSELGPIESWPQGLKTIVGLALASNL